jgi:8-oxo-dGTP pyrophosphatase MutT (NUDIX family)
MTRFSIRPFAEFALRIAHILLRLNWFIFKPMTVGVRVMMIKNNQVVLVLHSYQDAWFMPGGAVRRGETLEQAARREALEETGIILRKTQFLGTFSSFIEGKSDHVSLFLCEDFDYPAILPEGETASWSSKDYEIRKIQSFPIDQLPEKIADGHAKRIIEYLEHQNQPMTFGGGIW